MFQIPTQMNNITKVNAKTMYQRVVDTVQYNNVNGLEEIMKFNEDMQRSSANTGTLTKSVPQYDVEKIERSMVSALIKQEPGELHGKSMEAQQTIDIEGYYRGRYESVEGGTDTIGVGHKLSQEEHDGNYVMIGDERIDITTDLSDSQVLALWQQDDVKHTERFETDMKNRGLDANSFTPSMKKVLNRLTYNMGTVPKSLTDSLQKGDMEGFNTGLLRMVGIKGNTKLSAGLSRDRAKSYNDINENKITSFEFLKRKGGGSIYIYYDKNGNEVKKYESDKPLDKSNVYNKRYGL